METYLTYTVYWRQENGKDVVSDKCCNNFFKSSDGTCSGKNV